MRTHLRRACCALLLFAAAAVSAQNSGPASNGDFQFALTGATGSIQYNARQHGSSARGELTFTGAVEISGEDVDGTGGGGSSASAINISADIDCLRIQGNRAAMSGTITSSTIAGYEGVRVLMAVEDNGEGSKAPARDRFTWGVYRNDAVTWIPEDAEVPGDTGFFLNWIATDAEREDDAGIPSQTSSSVDCQSFAFGAYAFEDVAHGAGNIQVKP